MLEQIIFFPIFGKPLILYLGVLTYLLFMTVAAIPIITKRTKYKIKIKYHMRLAYLAIILATVHGTFGLLIYL